MTTDTIEAPASGAAELIAIPTSNALEVFTQPTAIDPMLERIRGEIDRFTADASTVSGRKKIASFAYKISQTKTALDAVGKRLADEQKEIPKKIDASRKRIRDTLDGWRDEVRAPLDAWEEQEEARIARHKAAIARLQEEPARTATAAQIRERLDEAEAVKIGLPCEEFAVEYAKAKDAAITLLRERLAAAEKYEAEQEELARLRREAEERAARDREEAIRREAADRARREAEEAAQRERDRIEAAARAQQEEAEKREADLRRQAEEAERRAAQAAEDARREEAARKEREEREAAARAADLEHRRSVNQAVLAALAGGGISEKAGRKVITMIAHGQVPHVFIRY